MAPSEKGSGLRAFDVNQGNNLRDSQNTMFNIEQVAEVKIKIGVCLRFYKTPPAASPKIWCLRGYYFRLPAEKCN